MKRKRHGSLGSFVAAFVLVLCLFFFGGACLLIEYNTRRTLYGQTELPISYRLEDGVPVLVHSDSNEPVFSVPTAVGRAAFSLLAPGKRVLVALWRGEIAAGKTLCNRFSSADAANP